MRDFFRMSVRFSPKGQNLGSGKKKAQEKLPQDDLARNRKPQKLPQDDLASADNTSQRPQDDLASLVSIDFHLRVTPQVKLPTDLRLRIQSLSHYRALQRAWDEVVNVCRNTLRALGKKRNAYQVIFRG
jgi:hypothetical protein